MKIGIIVAMEKELNQLIELLDHRKEEKKGTRVFIVGHIGNTEIVVQQCGIGKVNAAVGTVEMIVNYAPHIVISTGVAGGCNVNLNPMDVVVSTHCTYHDAYCGAECAPGQILGQPETFASPVELVEKALSIHSKSHIVSGEIVTGDWFVDSREKMQSILDSFPKAMAVDMESCAIAHTCGLYNVPFVSFRIISDVPLKDKKAAQYYDFWQKMAEDSFQITRSFLEKIID